MTLDLALGSGIVPVIDDKHKLIGLVGRPDLLKQNLNEKFVTIKRTD